MAERTRENSNGCWPNSTDVIAFRLGYLQATCDRILAQVTAMQTAPPKMSGLPSWLANLQDWSKRIELVHKLYRVLVWSRVVLWPAYVIGGMRYLGWL
jgi:hypothetical protein